jgi:hypothetical protein
MKVNLKCFATLANFEACDYKSNGVQHEISEHDTIRTLVTRLGLPLEEIKVIIQNGRVVGLDSKLQDDDDIGLAPITDEN